MAMLSRIIKKTTSSLIPLANTTQRNYRSAIFPSPSKNNIISRSSSSCANHFTTREVVFPRETLHSLYSTETMAMTMTSNFISRRFFSSRRNTNDGEIKAAKPVVISDSLLKPQVITYWKIKKYSEIDSTEGRFLISDGWGSRWGSRWQACFYPKGEPTEEEAYGRYLSLNLWPVDLTGPGYVKFRIYMTDQNTDKNVDIADGVFEFHEDYEYFWNTLMPLDEFRDPANGYLLNDACIINIEIYYKPGEENPYALDMKERNPKVQKGKHKFSKRTTELW